MKTIAAACATLLSIACVPTPPATPAPRSATPVAASFAKTWDAVIDIFAAKNIPIATLDRSSGFIATTQLSVPNSSESPYADCGSFMSKAYTPTVATYNVRVKEEGPAANVLVTVKWQRVGRTMAGTTGVADCSTRGTWETETEGAIKTRAEGR